MQSNAPTYRVRFEFVSFSVYNGEFLHCFSKGKKGRRKKKEGKKNEKELEEERSEVMLRKRKRKERQVEEIQQKRENKMIRLLSHFFLAQNIP